MNSLLSELRSGKFKVEDENPSATYYRTESGKEIRLLGSYVYVNRMAWRIKRALRKGSLK